MKKTLLLTGLIALTSCSSGPDEDSIKRFSNIIEKGQKDLRGRKTSFTYGVYGADAIKPSHKFLKEIELTDKEKDKITKTEMEMSMFGKDPKFEVTKYEVELTYTNPFDELIITSQGYRYPGKDKYNEALNNDVDRCLKNQYCSANRKFKKNKAKILEHYQSKGFKITKTYKKGEVIKSGVHEFIVQVEGINGKESKSVRLNSKPLREIASAK